MTIPTYLSSILPRKCNQANDFIEKLRDSNAALMSNVEELERQLAVRVSNYDALEEQISKTE